MAKEILYYMIENKHRLKKKMSGGYWIGKRALFGIFTPKKSGQIDDSIRIYNLHEKKTRRYKVKIGSKEKTDNIRTHNSIYLVLLEFYNKYQYPLSVDMQAFQELEAKPWGRP